MAFNLWFLREVYGEEGPLDVVTPIQDRFGAVRRRIMAPFIVIIIIALLLIKTFHQTGTQE